MNYGYSGVPGGSGAWAALGGFIFVFFLIMIVLEVIYFWSIGTLLKAALGQPKAMVLLLLIPFVNLVMPIVWGVQAHNLLKEREAGKDNSA